MTTLESQLRASLSAARGPDAVVLSREQLPSDEALDVTQAQLAMLVMRVNQQLAVEPPDGSRDVLTDGQKRSIEAVAQASRKRWDKEKQDG